MATAWIREYQDVGKFGSIPVAMESGTDQTPVTFSTTAPSAAFGSETKYIAVTASADYHYVVGNTGVTATTNALKIFSASGPLYIGVRPGQFIAIIAAV